MKFYIMTDLEGVAGVTDFENRQIDTHWNHNTRLRGSRLLTGEVNAAVDGLFEAGATQVIVNDGHGSGYTIDFESLDPRVQVVHGLDRPTWGVLLDETCDATLLIGAHAKACSPPAAMYHTMSKDIKEWSINGVSVGEMGLQALIAGHYGVPMIFVSGDYFACREIEQLVPGIVTAAVKKGLSRTSEVCFPATRARELIRSGVKKAVAKIGQIKPVTLDPPLVFVDKRFSDHWATTRSTEDVKIIDANTREIRADDIVDLMCKIYGYARDYKETPLPAPET